MRRWQNHSGKERRRRRAQSARSRARFVRHRSRVRELVVRLGTIVHTAATFSQLARVAEETARAVRINSAQLRALRFAVNRDLLVPLKGHYVAGAWDAAPGAQPPAQYDHHVAAWSLRDRPDLLAVLYRVKHLWDETEEEESETHPAQGERSSSAGDPPPVGGEGRKRLEGGG